jgi:hypothetical protein
MKPDGSCNKSTERIECFPSRFDHLLSTTKPPFREHLFFDPLSKRKKSEQEQRFLYSVSEHVSTKQEVKIKKKKMASPRRTGDLTDMINNYTMKPL